MLASNHRAGDDEADRSGASEIAQPVIMLFLLALFSVPLGFILYGAAGSAIGGMLIIGILIVFQLMAVLLLFHLPVLCLCKLFAWLSKMRRVGARQQAETRGCAINDTAS